MQKVTRDITDMMAQMPEVIEQLTGVNIGNLINSLKVPNSNANIVSTDNTAINTEEAVSNSVDPVVSITDGK